MDSRIERPDFRVLLIDDDEDEYALLESMLSQNSSIRIHLEWVDTYEAGVQRICSAEHAACLLDYRLGEKDGLDLLRNVTARGCEVPIILLTGQGGYDVDVEAMEAGASDYLVKGQITLDLLERSIRYSVMRKRADLELKKYRDYLEQLVQERTRELEEANGKLQIEITERERVRKEREKLILELQEALANVKVLRGLLPICAWCKKIRDDQGYWQQIEGYIRDHTEADFSHSICPACAEKARKDMGLAD